MRYFLLLMAFVYSLTAYANDQNKKYYAISHLDITSDFSVGLHPMGRNDNMYTHSAGVLHQVINGVLQPSYSGFIRAWSSQEIARGIASGMLRSINNRDENGAFRNARFYLYEFTNLSGRLYDEQTTLLHWQTQNAAFRALNLEAVREAYAHHGSIQSQQIRSALEIRIVHDTEHVNGISITERSVINPHYNPNLTAPNPATWTGSYRINDVGTVREYLTRIRSYLNCTGIACIGRLNPVNCFNTRVAPMAELYESEPYPWCRVAGYMKDPLTPMSTFEWLWSYSFVREWLEG